MFVSPAFAQAAGAPAALPDGVVLAFFVLLGLYVAYFVISLTVFAGFSWLYLGERLGWQHAVGFALICVGAWFVFHDWG